MAEIIEDCLKAEAAEIIQGNDRWRKCAPDHPPCAMCKKIIVDVPLLMWRSEGKEMLAFHFSCAMDPAKWDASEPEAVEPGTAKDLERNNAGCFMCPQIAQCPHLHVEEKAYHQKMVEDGEKWIAGDD